MRFFILGATNIAHGESEYHRIREKLSGALGPIKDRRIQCIRFEEESKSLTLTVGDSFRRLGSEPVIAIIEGDNSYFVCTAHHGADTGDPFQIPRNKVLSSSDFTAVA